QVGARGGPRLGPRQLEGVAREQAQRAGRGRDVQARRGLLADADLGGAPVVLEDVLQVRWIVAPAAVHAVESLRVSTRIVVDLEAVVRGLEDVVHLAAGDGFRDGLLRLAIVPGQLE